MSEILVSARQLSIRYGANPVIEGLQFSIHERARIGLVGPNGMGKSSLLRVLAGEQTPDAGEVVRRRGLRVGYLPQVPQFDPNASVEEVLLSGTSLSEDWEQVGAAQEMISRLGLEPYRKTATGNLSGGWKKRLALARELSRRPELLLLDEPTNHLDLETVLWLEDYLKRAPFATLTVTHDRTFLDRVSSRIAELNRRFPEGWFESEGNYLKFIENREQFIDGLVSRQQSLSNVFRRETEWLRRGAKARTTKQQARIQRAVGLEQEVRDLESRNRTRSVGIDFQAGDRLSKKLVSAQGISKTLGGRTLFTNIDLILRPGSRLGIVGPNGLGKTTLIRVLLKEMQPDTGVVQHADGLEVAYFEQNREILDPELTLGRSVCPTGDMVIFGGAPVHVRGYLDRFLFGPEQMDLKVGKLSGGEQSRLLLAKLMLAPANLLVLDEPTNDLDLSTLAVLETAIEDFPGAVIVVSHDRKFLDHTVDLILAFSPRGTNTFEGVEQYESFLRAGDGATRLGEGAVENKAAKPRPAESADGAIKKKRLSFGEQREFAQMETRLLEAEAKVNQLTQRLENPNHGLSPIEFKRLGEELHTAIVEVDRLYERWAELESKTS